MIKAIYAVAASLMVATVVALAPSFVSSVQASEPVAMSTHDKVEAAVKCGEQAWPNIDAACLRTTDNKTVSRPVRVISTSRS